MGKWDKQEAAGRIGTQQVVAHAAIASDDEESRFIRQYRPNINRLDALACDVRFLRVIDVDLRNIEGDTLPGHGRDCNTPCVALATFPSSSNGVLL